MEPLITVIIPVYNVVDYLERCINSVLIQDYKHLEILLIDDGSNDGSENICEQYVQQDARIQVIHKKNGGLGPARNTALDIARGDYILFIDSDDYIIDGIIKKLYDACKKYDADIACCGYKSGNKIYYCENELEVFGKVEAAQKMLMGIGMDANAWCKLYKRELFQQIRFPACAYEVVPVTYKVFWRAEKVVNIKVCGYYCEKRNGSITRSSFGSNNLLYITLSKKMMEDIKENYPELIVASEVFYLNALIVMTEKSREDRDASGKKEYQIINREFKCNFRKIMHCPEITKRKKMISWLLKLRIYAVVKSIYNRIG